MTTNHTSKREQIRLRKKQAALCCYNLIRNWQVDGVPSSGIEPDSDEVWRIVEWIQRRIEKHSKAKAKSPDHRK